MYEDIAFENLGKGIKIAVSREHRFGTDAFLLADFANARKKDEVCDLCTGSGIVALLIIKNNQPKQVYAVEIQQKAHDMLVIAKNESKLETLTPVLSDLKDWRSERELDLITCNPPYKLNDTGIKNESDAVTIARHEIMCNIHDVCECAARSLKFGGRLCICNRPERLCDVLTAMRECKIEPKRVRFVSKTPNDAPWLFLVEGKKGSKPFMKVDPPLFIQDENGNQSDELKAIYGLI